MTVDDNIMKIIHETATQYLYHPDDDKPTEVTRHDIDEAFAKMFSSTLLKQRGPDLTSFFPRPQLPSTGKTLRFRRYEPINTSMPLGNDGCPPCFGAVRCIESSIDIDSGASGISIGALSSNGEDSALSRQQQWVQLPSGSPGFTEKLISRS